MNTKLINHSILDNQIITIEKISGIDCTKLCCKIIADLPEYFGLPEANEHYATGVTSKKNFAARVGEDYVGLLSLEFPYLTNSNIYWLGVLKKYQGRGIGKALLKAASSRAKAIGTKTITVETLAPTEEDENYLKTYNWYVAQGFNSLFNLRPIGYEWNMVYMIKCLIK